MGAVDGREGAGEGGSGGTLKRAPSAPERLLRSEPARSTRWNLATRPPGGAPGARRRRISSVNTAWLRLLVAFIAVAPEPTDHMAWVEPSPRTLCECRHALQLAAASGENSSVVGPFRLWPSVAYSW